MAAPDEDCSNWLLDLVGFDDMPVPVETTPFQWPPNAFSVPSSTNAPRLDVSDGSSSVLKECNSKKRVRSEACNATDTKAHREKMRRDRLNDRFQELSSVLDPGKPPRMDKSAILSDAVRTVTQLRDEAEKLKKSFEDLQEKVNELKAEKNELRDEKQKLKSEKDKLEQQLKTLNTQPSFFPHPSAIPPPFPAPPQVLNSKLVPFVGYPGIPMWQFVPPSAVDTSEDHALRPPVA